MKRLYFFSKHFVNDKDIDSTLAIDCINTGKRELDERPNKFKSRKQYKKGELIVIWKDRGEKCFIITAFWNLRGVKI